MRLYYGIFNLIVYSAINLIFATITFAIDLDYAWLFINSIYIFIFLCILMYNLPRSYSEQETCCNDIYIMFNAVSIFIAALVTLLSYICIWNNVDNNYLICESIIGGLLVMSIFFTFDNNA
jgi:hypothetical protein